MYNRVSFPAFRRFLMTNLFIFPSRLGPKNVSPDDEEHCIDCAPLALKARSGGEARPSSAKIRMILKVLRETDERSQGQEKTIIFSQFTTMLDLIEPFLQDKGVGYVRCESSLSFS